MMATFSEQLRQKYGERMGYKKPNTNYVKELQSLMVRRARLGMPCFTVHFSDRTQDMIPGNPQVFYPRNSKSMIVEFLKREGFYFKEWVEHIEIDMVKIPENINIGEK
jgi:hypothetical protein